MTAQQEALARRSLRDALTCCLQSNIRKSGDFICEKYNQSVFDKKVIPDVAKMTGLSRELRPTKVHHRKVDYRRYMLVFGMSMSDGQRVIARDDSDAVMTAELPEKLTRIEVIFTKDEKWLHSMNFIGETVVNIGVTDYEGMFDGDSASEWRQ